MQLLDSEERQRDALMPFNGHFLLLPLSLNKAIFIAAA
jgi:hypothetical protein